MTTFSHKLLVRFLPIGAILAVAVVVALTFAPDTFRYRGWPKAPGAAPLQSLAELAPRLGGGAVSAPGAVTRSGGSAPVAPNGTRIFPSAQRSLAGGAAGSARSTSPATGLAAGPAPRGGGQPRTAPSGGSVRSRGQSGAAAGGSSSGLSKSVPPSTPVARAEPPASSPSPSYGPVAASNGGRFDGSDHRHDYARRIRFADGEYGGRDHSAAQDGSAGCQPRATAAPEPHPESVATPAAAPAAPAPAPAAPAAPPAPPAPASPAPAPAAPAPAPSAPEGS